MTACLVGSELCIRERLAGSLEEPAGKRKRGAAKEKKRGAAEEEPAEEAAAVGALSNWRLY